MVKPEVSAATTQEDASTAVEDPNASTMFKAMLPKGAVYGDFRVAVLLSPDSIPYYKQKEG